LVDFKFNAVQLKFCEDGALKSEELNFLPLRNRFSIHAGKCTKYQALLGCHISQYQSVQGFWFPGRGETHLCLGNGAMHFILDVGLYTAQFIYII
jgi:hypothetical protein